MRHTLFIVLIMLFIVVKTKAQSLDPAVLNTAGNTATQSGIVFEWSVGELAIMETMSNGNSIITHGFLQPLVLISSITPIDLPAVYPSNILTVNGDGKNDAWTIKNIENYPENEVIVFNRAGRIVYNAVNYQNNWTGTSSGLTLAEGTYYFIIKLVKDPRVKSIKGFITILH